jgi:hypothetical protein
MMMPAMMPMVAVVVVVGAKHSFHAANSTADRSADDSANRTSDAVAFMEAMNRAAGNALSLCGERKGKCGDTCAANK